jgi:hypothetical protein
MSTSSPNASNVTSAGHTSVGTTLQHHKRPAQVGTARSRRRRSRRERMKRSAVIA